MLNLDNYDRLQLEAMQDGVDDVIRTLQFILSDQAFDILGIKSMRSAIRNEIDKRMEQELKAALDDKRRCDNAKN